MENSSTPPRPSRSPLRSPSPRSKLSMGDKAVRASPSRSSPSSKKAALDKGVNMHAMVRVRAPTEAEAAAPNTGAVEFGNNNVKVVYGPNKCFSKQFQFDDIFRDNVTQKEIFDSSARDLVDNSIEGFNSTIFAYGPSGSGKSHTIQGKIDSDVEAGLITRAVYQIFEKLEATDHEFGLRVSCLEIYNEELIDLLNFTSEDKRVKLVDDAHRGCISQNLEELCLQKPSDITSILEKANHQRIDKEQENERHLRRSNIIVTIKIMVKECNNEGDELIRQGQLNIVDFAGCEVSFKAGENELKERYHTTDRVIDVGKINNSMLVFGRVVNAIVDGHHHIPYRDSKLTRLLQDSLGGKAKCALIATISSAKSMWEETMATLEIATRVRSIKSHPSMITKTSKRWVMKEFLQEIDELKHCLQITREKNGIFVDPDKFFEMNATIKAYDSTKDEFLKMKTDYTRLNEENLDLKTKNEDLTEELTNTQSDLSATEVSLLKTKKALSQTRSTLEGSEAVVLAQTTTEQVLYKQGSQLQDTLDARETDVEKLLNKVGRMTGKEEQRLKESGAFVSQLVCDNNDLVTNVQVFQNNSQQHCADLCQSVMDMVSRGKASSEFLSGLIEKALGALKDDAASGQSSLASSCGDLKETLSSTQVLLEETLKTLQESSSAWVADANNKLSAAQSHLSTQQQEIEAMTASIDSHTKALVASTADFVSLQEKHKSDTATTTAALKTAVHDKLDAYENHVKDEVAAMNETLRVQAEDMKSAMMAFTRKFIENATATNASIMSEAALLSSNTSEINARGEKKLSSLNKEIMVACDQHIVDSDATLAANTQSYMTALEDIGNMRNDMILAFSSNRSFNSSNGSKLGQTITESIMKGNEFTVQSKLDVDGVTDKSKVIIENFDKASKTLQADVSASLQALTSTLGEDGKAVSQESAKHLEATQSHATEQQQRLQQSSKTASNYEVKIVSTKLEPLPEDPTSLQKHSKVVLVETEDHAEIKEKAAAFYHQNAPSFSGSNDENMPVGSGSKDSVISFVSTKGQNKVKGPIFRIATNDPRTAHSLGANGVKSTSSSRSSITSKDSHVKTKSSSHIETYASVEFDEDAASIISSGNA